MNDFFKCVRDFLLNYLPKQKGASDNTILSYKMALNLFVTFMKDVKRITPVSLEFEAVNSEIVKEFLDWIENTRCCSVTTRNQRLAALRSFFEYAGLKDISVMNLSFGIQEIPIKKAHGKIVEYLSEPALETLLKQPDLKKSKGLRDLFLMILMYDTAARCAEIIGLKLSDLHLDTDKPKVYLHGKGNKTRVVPLMPKTVEHCKRYLKKYHPNSDQKTDKDVLLFYTTSHRTRHTMSVDAVEAIYKKYGKSAAEQCNDMPANLHPHMMRHTRAMHLYRSGMPLELLSQYLGHADIETTLIYAYADTEMKREAIRKADVVRDGKEVPVEIWADDEDMILKLSGLK